MRTLEVAARKMIAIALTFVLVGALALFADDLIAAKKEHPVLLEMRAHEGELLRAVYDGDADALARKSGRLSRFIGENNAMWQAHWDCLNATNALYIASLEFRRPERREAGQAELKKYRTALDKCQASVDGRR